MDSAAVSSAILGGLLVDDARAGEVVTAVAAWIDAHPDEVADHAVAWAAAKSVELGLAAIAGGAAARPPDRAIRMFRDLTVAGQVTVALHDFCGFDDDQIVEATARPASEVKLLLDTVGDDSDVLDVLDLEHDPDLGSGREPEPAPESGPPPPPPVVMPPPTASVSSTRPSRRLTSTRSSRPRWWIIVAAVVLALVAAGIAANNVRDDQPTSAPSPRSGLGDAASVSRSQLSAGCGTPAGDAALTPDLVATSIDGTDRSYRLIAAAPVAPGRPRPLVIDFGDLGETVDEHVAASRFDDLAAALKLVVATVVPADGPAQWNVTGDADAPDDAALVEQIISEQAQALCIDRTRVLLAGRGAGAHFAAAFACAHPGEVSGLILVAGVYRPATCATEERFSLLAVTGAEDDVYPAAGGNSTAFDDTFGPTLRGGSRYEPASTEVTLDSWAEGLGCSSRASQQIGLATARIDTTCDHDGEVWRVEVPGAGHEWYPATYDLMVQFLTTGPFRTA